MFTPRAHLRSPRISFESIVRLLLTDFGVVPRTDEREQGLAASEADFERYRTWSTDADEFGPSGA